MGEKLELQDAPADAKDLARRLEALADLRKCAASARHVIQQRDQYRHQSRQNEPASFDPQLQELLRQIEHDLHVLIGQPEPEYAEDTEIEDAQTGLGKPNPGAPGSGKAPGGTGAAPVPPPTLGIDVFECPHCTKLVRVSKHP